MYSTNFPSYMTESGQNETGRSTTEYYGDVWTSGCSWERGREEDIEGIVVVVMVNRDEMARMLRLDFDQVSEYTSYQVPVVYRV